MHSILGFAVLFLAAGGPANLKDRERHPLAPSLPLLTKDESARIDAKIERFIQYDIGKLTGAAGKKALDEFKALGPESIFNLIDGLNRAANMESSCPAVIIAKKVAGYLVTTEDLALLTYAKDNIGAGVTAKRHLNVIKDLQSYILLRKGVLQQRAVAKGGVKSPAGMSPSELEKAGKGAPKKGIEVPSATEFSSPIQDPKGMPMEWKPHTKFGDAYTFSDSKGVQKKWGQFLGDRMNLKGGTTVVAAANGIVHHVGVYPGNKDKPNHGGFILIGHLLAGGKSGVFTLYGQVRFDSQLKPGQIIRSGQVIGSVAEANDPANGFNPEGLYFAINLDPIGINDRGKRGPLREGIPYRYSKSFIDGKDHPAPSRTLDYVGPSHVLGLQKEDRIQFLRDAEADPKRRQK